MRHVDEWGAELEQAWVTGCKGVFNIQPVFIESLLCARHYFRVLGYISEQSRERFLLSWILHSSSGRETISNKHSKLYCVWQLKIRKEEKVEQVKGVQNCQGGMEEAG